MLATKSSVFCFADLEVREREFCLIKAGEVVPVEPKAFRVLLILLRNPQKLITKEELLNAVWGDTAVSENSLTRSIALLRRLLGDDIHHPRYIETVATVGYRFVCPVEVEEHPQDKADGEVQSTAGNGDEAKEAARSGPRAARPVFKKWVILAATAPLASLVLLVWINIFGLRDRVLHRGESQSASGFQIEPVTNAAGSAILPALSPEEREVAFLWDGPERKYHNIYVLLLGSDTPLRLTDSKDGMLGAPAWSPDGREIAFSRCGGKNDGVFIVPALGGVERNLTHVGCPYNLPSPLAWVSNGQEMLMIDHCPEAGSLDLVFFSFASGKKRCLTHSGPRNAFDSVFQFSVSRDGKRVAFTASAAAPCQGDIYTIPLSGGTPHPLTAGGRCFVEFPQTTTGLMWTPDSKSIVFASRSSMLLSLWRVSADGGPVERETFYPAIGNFSRDSRHLVYSDQTVTEGPTIWRADLASAGEPPQKNRELIRTQFQEISAQPSPDGTRIVWRSDRTGHGEIWTSGAAGESPLQLTRLGWYSGTPRWSPDGRWISFNKVVDNRRQIFMINSEGRELRQITDGPYDNIESSWSRDGRSIYFTSMRTGSWQVWKHTLEGGVELQLTTNGGYDSFESYDGKMVYFTKFDQPGIWSIPANGGTESLVIADKPQLAYWGYWGVTRAGLYLLNMEAEPEPRIEFYSFPTRRASPVFTLAKKPWPGQSTLSATADGKTIYYTLYDQQSVIKMMEFSR